MTETDGLLGTGRHRVHPLTPLLKAWKGLTAIVVIVVVNSSAGLMAALGALGGMASGAPLVLAALILGAVLLVVAAIVGITAWSWRERFFELDPDELRIGHGILFRQRRTARYDRIQSVDVRQPLVPRLFGLGELSVETAGGADSTLVIAYLDVPKLERVRADLLAAVQAGRAPTEDPAPSVPSAEPADPSLAAAPGFATAPGSARTLAGPVPGPMLIGMIVLTFGAGALVALCGALIAGIFGGGLFGGLIAAGGAFALIWVPLDRYWRQTLRLDDEQARLQVTAGLASTRRQTVPLRRIHALRVSRRLLWRIPGWAELTSSIAGYGAADEQTGETTLIAVGEDAAVTAAAGAILDRLAVGDRRPTRTWRSPAAARWISPVDWFRQSVSLSEWGIAVTWGRLTERTSLVPWRHVQGATLTRGPLQRLLGVADVRAAVVAGPAQVIARDLAVEDARLLLAEIVRARQGLAR